jgi:hypothetical protein
VQGRTANRSAILSSAATQRACTLDGRLWRACRMSVLISSQCGEVVRHYRVKCFG